MKFTEYVQLGILFALIAGCASNAPTFADRVLADGETRIELARQWEQGQENRKLGEKRVKKGTSLIEEGRDEVEDGESLVAVGSAAILNQRKAYQATLLGTRSIDSADTAAEHASELRNIVRDWEAGEEKLAKGQKLIKRGNVLVAEGERELTEGKALIESGQLLMHAAENEYLKERPRTAVPG